MDSLRTTAIVRSEAKLSTAERSRLYCRRLGYCDTNLFQKIQKMPEYSTMPKLCALNEVSKDIDEAKFRPKSYHRKGPEYLQSLLRWHRAYVDGGGGGGSLGGESYEGAIGGYLFVCPSTGERHHKLYASHEQFPAALLQFLVQVENEGNHYRETYVDTYGVNIRAEADEVTGIFRARIVPVSAGSPQEVSFVETAHRAVAGRSRVILLGAPHLPKWCWVLADKYTVHTGRFLPQNTRGWYMSYFLNTGRTPDWIFLCIHVFGAPCTYAPMDGPVQKRTALTEEGPFVGIQHPTALVIRKRDMKLASVSTKKD